jgi:hypothetical protein
MTALDDIRNKYLENEKKIKGTKIFTEIAKYCVDRNKLPLALKLIEWEKHSGRRIMVAMLILAVKQDNQFVEKIL